MKKVILLKIGFWSYIKLFAFSGAGIGIAIGVIAFIVGALGGDVNANIGSTTYAGFSAGVISLFLYPILSTLTSALFAAVMYLPFRLALKIFKGLKIRLHTEAIDTEINKDDMVWYAVLSNRSKHPADRFSRSCICI